MDLYNILLNYHSLMKGVADKDVEEYTFAFITQLIEQINSDIESGVTQPLNFDDEVGSLDITPEDLDIINWGNKTGEA